MDYKHALKIGQMRRREAAKVLRQWTGLKACEVCAVRPRPRIRTPTNADWEPVGDENYKDVMTKKDALTSATTSLLVVDADGNVKACAWEALPLEEALSMASRLPLPVSQAGVSELRRHLEEQDMRESVMGSTLHQEF